jgi:hypothetical protein
MQKISVQTHIRADKRHRYGNKSGSSFQHETFKRGKGRYFFENSFADLMFFEKFVLSSRKIND